MGEPFDQYVTVLRQMAARCEHDKITSDELLWDRIVFGIAEGKVRERLLREDNLDLKKTLTAQIRKVSKLGEMSVNTVETKRERPARKLSVINQRLW